MTIHSYMALVSYNETDYFENNFIQIIFTIQNLDPPLEKSSSTYALSKYAHIYSNLLTCNIPFLECHSHCESKRWFLAWYNCWPSWVYQYPNSLTTVKERDYLLEKCRSKPTGHYGKTVSFSTHDSSHFINPCNSSLKYTVKIFVLSSTHICM